jgi:sugar phosphate isomerase/epimerase
MNRRQFLAAASGAISLRASASAGQPFTAGIVPAGRGSAPGQVEGFWEHCDEVASLGFHQIEINNTRAKIAEYYSDRTSEFKDEMARRRLSLPGLALFSRASLDGERAEVLTHHLLLGRFLAAVGGKYITHMLAIGDVLNEPVDVAAYRDVDLTTWVKNTNEMGRRLVNEHGIKLAYHPEQDEVRTGLYKRFLESTDERFVYFLPDTGHIALGGAEAVEVCHLYRSRLACVHLKDFAPVPEDGKPVKAGNVPFGAGIVHFPAIIAELEKSNFTGYVMSEGGGTNQAMRDYMLHSLKLHLA